MDTDTTQQDGAVAAQAHWQAEYNFWHKIITEEVERLRWNAGYEPLELNLYEAASRKYSQPDFGAQTYVGRQLFYATAKWCFDQEGKKILKIKVFPSQALHNQALDRWAKSAQRLYNDPPAP